MCVCVCDGILLSHKKELNDAICSNNNNKKKSDLGSIGNCENIGESCVDVWTLLLSKSLHS